MVVSSGSGREERTPPGAAPWSGGDLLGLLAVVGGDHRAQPRGVLAPAFPAAGGVRALGGDAVAGLLQPVFGATAAQAVNLARPLAGAELEGVAGRPLGEPDAALAAAGVGRRSKRRARSAAAWGRAAAFAARAARWQAICSGGEIW